MGAFLRNPPLALNGNEKHQHNDPSHSSQAYIEVEQHDDDDDFNGSQPQAVNVPDGGLESRNVIGDQIHHLTHVGTSERRSAQLQRLPVDQGSGGDFYLHPHHKLVVHEIVLAYHN